MAIPIIMNPLHVYTYNSYTHYQAEEPPPCLLTIAIHIIRMRNPLHVYLIRQTSLMALTLASFTSSTPSLVRTTGAGSEIAWSKYGKHRSWIFQRSASSCMDSAFSRGVDPNVCMVLRTGGIQNWSKKAWLYMDFIRSGSTLKELDTMWQLTYHTQQELWNATAI